MTTDLNAWLALAVETDDGSQANAVIDRQRRERSESLGGAVRSYEVSVKDGETLLAVAERVRPLFAYHMDSLGLPTGGSAWVFFSVFARGRLHVVESAAAIALFDQAIQDARPVLALPGRPSP